VKLEKVMLDLPAKNKETYLKAVEQTLQEHIRIEAEFKADLHYPAVAAASILAKVTRDAAMRKEEKAIGFPLGSGYPADPVTRIALEQRGDILLTHPVTRKSWKTITAYAQRKQQQELTQFSP
jgi:ribonuclease HII